MKLSVEYKGARQPIRYYRERELETGIVCSSCTLEYAIYGVFAYCPDCGVHNSLQILKKNFELAEKELALSAATEDRDFAAYLVGDALENAVAAFDGFGRQVCSIHAAKATNPKKAEALSFQSLPKTRANFIDLFGYDLAGMLDTSAWDFVIRCFQKRHLLSHAMGVVDQQYVNLTHDPVAVVGRKITINTDEVRRLMELLLQVSGGLIDHFGKPQR